MSRFQPEPLAPGELGRSSANESSIASLPETDAGAAPETPLNSFTRCHLGIVTQLEGTARLPELVDVANHARHMAQTTLDLFRQTIIPHHAEEEAELFPAVLQSANAAERKAVRGMVERLTAEHREVEGLWKRLEPSVRAAARGNRSEVDAEVMEEMVRAFLRHARYEETVFLPLAERILGRNGNHMAALGLALHLRHVPQVVGYI
ncbi:MAG TPA: hemerythrin domain-containing protein [Ramlibacter sp.]|uniref:hemerythrin domain-containing protein n=1 Tax=Ramlibacter sp. TaxID=1917967 RepID=UPI002D7FCD01|nr:hemerythrin domain-containing protein [Ramlibacter sp.]HET8745271.1 hemerythrin domain-containing protein [Ramlibacter sp.]